MFKLVNNISDGVQKKVYFAFHYLSDAIYSGASYNRTLSFQSPVVLIGDVYIVLINDNSFIGF